MRNKKFKSGFTLVEILFAIIMVGLAIASLIAASSSFTRANAAGVELSTAEFLTEQIRELTTLLPVVDPETEDDVFGPESGESLADYDDLDDFDDKNFNPPINANRDTLNNFAGFSQQITVENVSASNFENVVPNHTSHFVRVTVKVFLNSRQITSTSWIRARY